MNTVPKMTRRMEEVVIAQALDILRLRLGKSRNLVSDAESVADYLKLKLGRAEQEVFGILFLDIKNKLIKNKILFYGTLNHAQVYPREVIKESLACNAAGIILYHNHPSGEVSPSPADLTLTKTLKQVLLSVDVKLLDHFIVAGTSTFSFSSGGLL